MKTTIAAVATVPGQGGIAVVRISGGDAKKILDLSFKSKRPVRPRYASLGCVLDGAGEVIDEAIAIYMPSPNSYTREDVVEIQCHGGRVVTSRILNRVIQLGAVPAAPGEFTKRAFLNGRIDLAQAEAVMNIITAENEASARSALRQLRGGVSKKIQDIANGLLNVLSDIEAACDFPEEIDQEIQTSSVKDSLLKAFQDIDRAIDPKKARLITHGVNAAIIGKPNTGKSSVLNAIIGFDRAIVSPKAGTTRDAVSASVVINGINVNITDTAGQRETDDEIENIGVRVAKRTETEADIALLVLDGSRPLEDEDIDILSRADDRFIIAVNKKDVYKDSPAFDVSKFAFKTVMISAVDGNGGIDDLIKAVEEYLPNTDPENDTLTVERHIKLAEEARDYIKNAIESAENGFPLDLCAVDVQLAVQSILSIRGLDASEEAIDGIFSRFCVGK